MPHVHLPGGSQVFCSWSAWKAQPSRLLVENMVPLVAAGRLLTVLPSLAPHSSFLKRYPLLTSTCTLHSCTTAAGQKSGCILLLQARVDKQEENLPILYDIAQHHVTTHSKEIMDMKPTCLQQQKFAYHLYFGKSCRQNTCQVKKVQVLVHMKVFFLFKGIWLYSAC